MSSLHHFQIELENDVKMTSKRRSNTLRFYVIICLRNHELVI